VSERVRLQVEHDGGRVDVEMQAGEERRTDTVLTPEQARKGAGPLAEKINLFETND
jgi:hypothetical protein